MLRTRSVITHIKVPKERTGSPALNKRPSFSWGCWLCCGLIPTCIGALQLFHYTNGLTNLPEISETTLICLTTAAILILLLSLILLWWHNSQSSNNQNTAASIQHNKQTSKQKISFRPARIILIGALMGLISTGVHLFLFTSMQNAHYSLLQNGQKQDFVCIQDAQKTEMGFQVLAIPAKGSILSAEAPILIRLPEQTPLLLGGMHINTQLSKLEINEPESSAFLKKRALNARAAHVDIASETTGITSIPSKLRLRIEHAITKTDSQLSEEENSPSRSDSLSKAKTAEPTEQSYQKQARQLIEALVLGIRVDLFASPLFSAARSLGLSHILAVSGAHLVIIMGLIGTLLSQLRFSKKSFVTLLSLSCLAYLLLTGVPISALRASIMALICLTSLLGNRRACSLHALSLTLIGFSLLDPWGLLSLSLQLSALASFGIIVFAPLFSCWIEAFVPHLPKSIRSLAAMTCSAVMLTFPVSMEAFHQFSLLVLAGNLIAGIFVPIMCSLGIIAGLFSLLAPKLGALLFIPSLALAQTFIEALYLLSSIPHASIPLPDVHPIWIAMYYLLALSLYVYWPKVHVKSIIAASISFICALSLSQTLIRLYSPDEIYILDVGQGDAVLIKSQGQAMLMDTGADNAKLLSNLGASQTFSLNYLSISHADKDHCQAMDALINTIPTDTVLLSKPSNECPSPKVRALIGKSYQLNHQSPHFFDYHESIDVGHFRVTCLGPTQFTAEGENPDSLCLLIELDTNQDGFVDWSMLNTGDAESSIIDPLISKESLGHIDIYKLAHHGAKESMSQDILELKPYLGLISCGLNNRYGHPKLKPLEYLKKDHIPYIRTDLQGRTRISLGPNELRLWVEHPDALIE